MQGIFLCKSQMGFKFTMNPHMKEVTGHGCLDFHWLESYCVLTIPPICCWVWFSVSEFQFSICNYHFCLYQCSNCHKSQFSILATNTTWLSQSRPTRSSVNYQFCYIRQDILIITYVLIKSEHFQFSILVTLAFGSSLLYVSIFSATVLDGGHLSFDLEIAMLISHLMIL